MRRGTAKRRLINTGTDKRYVRRGPQGRFSESDDVGTSLTADRRKRARRRRSADQRDKVIDSVAYWSKTVIDLYNKSTDELLGTITEADLQVLTDALEEESSDVRITT